MVRDLGESGAGTRVLFSWARSLTLFQTSKQILFIMQSCYTTLLSFIAFLSTTRVLSALQITRAQVIASGVLAVSSSMHPAQALGGTIAQPSKILRVVFNGGDNMLGRAVQLSFHNQSPGEELIRDSCPSSHYLDMCLHPSGHPDGDLTLDEIRRQNQKGNYLWKDYRKLIINPPPDVRLLNLESHITRSIDNEDVPKWKGIRYHTHVDNLDAMICPYAETTHGALHASPVIVSLANNHAMDYGRMALDLETLPSIENLEANVPNVHTVGIGRNWSCATKPAVFECAGCGTEVQVFAASSGCSGTPSTWWANGDRSGVVGIPALTSRDAVDEAVKIVKKAIDAHPHSSENVRILSVHMGPNWAMKGEDETDVACRREFAHRVIDSCGVDLVYGHSSHHVRGLEVYHGKLIMYGTGDLINDYEGFENRGEEEYNRLGGIFIADVNANSGDFVKLRIVPCYMNRLRLERYRRGSKIWSPRERRLVTDDDRGRDFADFINKLSEIDAGGVKAALSVSYVDEDRTSVPGGPILVSDTYASN